MYFYKTLLGDALAEPNHLCVREREGGVRLDFRA